MADQRAVIIGAGPAGLTAAYELVSRSTIKPIILEMSDTMGGFARTVNYKGNRIDIGGHRFFSKSDRVMNWWLHLIPIQMESGSGVSIRYQGKQTYVKAPAEKPYPQEPDRVLFVRERKSRIYYRRKFFDYPITLSKTTITNLGVGRMVRIALSYAKSRMLPIRNEQNLEQFLTLSWHCIQE